MSAPESADEHAAEVSTYEVSPLWNMLENQGVKLPEYLCKLLSLTGYCNIHSLSKLTDNKLITELEQYATDNLDASDLGLSMTEEKFYFSRRTNKFSILPGHKHLLADAAVAAQRIVQKAEEEAVANDQHVEDSRPPSAEDNKAGMSALHFLSELATTSMNNRVMLRSAKKNGTTKPTAPISSQIVSTLSVEEEQQSLTDYMKSWIDRKILSGQVEPLVFEVDYKINVVRPQTGPNQPPLPDSYSFICVRCNTSIKAFKRPNGMSWNAANVCRHLSIVHCHPNHTPSKQPSKRRSRDVSLLAGSLSTPPLSDDTPMEQDHYE